MPCSIRIPTGSARSGGGAHSPCALRGTSRRSAAPACLRSSGLPSAMDVCPRASGSWGWCGPHWQCPASSREPRTIHHSAAGEEEERLAFEFRLESVVDIRHLLAKLVTLSWHALATDLSSSIRIQCRYASNSASSAVGHGWPEYYFGCGFVCDE